MDAKTGNHVGQTAISLARQELKEQIARWKEKGQVGRLIRAVVVGIPNVGKSTFINQVAGRKSAKAGILWPKFEDERVGLHLAYTGAVKDDIMDVETLGCRLMDDLAEKYPEALQVRYKIEILRKEPEQDAVAYGYMLLQEAAAKRGFRISGGELDTERMAYILLDEFRGGKLGRFTLETPEELQK